MISMAIASLSSFAAVGSKSNDVNHSVSGTARVQDLIYGYVVDETSALPDFAKIKNVQKRKELFIEHLAPIVTSVNYKISSKRNRLGEIYNLSDWRDKDISFVKRHMDDYGIKNSNDLAKVKSKETLNQLLKKIDIVPLPLTLAQAAIESGWGTSRFAKEANNLFGQWCYKKGCGVIPNKRNENAAHEVRKFITIEESVRKYMYNLNTHRAYSDLREIRHQNRHIGDKIELSSKIAEGLEKYSQKGRAYIDIINSIINDKNFTKHIKGEKS